MEQRRTQHDRETIENCFEINSFPILFSKCSNLHEEECKSEEKSNLRF